MSAKDRVDACLNTIDRLEPDIAPIHTPAALASIAISLKRIADALEAPDKSGLNVNGLLHVLAHAAEGR